jgi:hypothetical protein
LQSIMGNVLSNKNITSLPSDVGANLVGGLSSWTANLMGGQDTLDSAARMIQMADPKSNMADPTSQAAVATLKQALDLHPQLNGGVQHPVVQAMEAARQSATGGMTAPNTVQPMQSQVPIQAPAVAAGVQPPGQVPGQNYGAATAYTGGVPPSAYGWTPPGANYSYGNVPPWLAQPGPSFIAPTAPPSYVTS